MFKIHVSKVQTSILVAVGIILAILLVTAVTLNLTKNASFPSISAVHLISANVASGSISAYPGTTPIVSLDEHTLRSMLAKAYDNWNANGRMLLHVLNGRFEHRCCGLPR